MRYWRWLRWADPAWYLKRVLWHRLIHQVDQLATQVSPGSADQAEWLIRAEKFRAELDGHA